LQHSAIRATCRSGGRVRYTIKHTIETDVDSFWGKLFFDVEYNRALFSDFLGFTTYRVLEDRTEPNGERHRQVECVPKIELPAAMRKIFGNSVGYVEMGRFDPATRKYFVNGVPKVAADKVKTSSEIWAEPLGDKRCERIVTIDNTVKVFGLGTLIEGFIEQQTRDLYARAADFTNRWIREKGL
jgi:Protein of unknown function (DUF2505)